MKKLKLLLPLILFSVSLMSQVRTIPKGLSEFDISTLSAKDTFVISTDYNSNALMGLQISFETLADTADGVFTVYQKNQKSTQYVLVDTPQLPWLVTDSTTTMFFEKHPLYADKVIFIFEKNKTVVGTIKFENRIRMY